MTIYAPSGSYVLASGTYATSATVAAAMQVTGDSTPRFAILANGALQWGPGNGPSDLQFDRLDSQNFRWIIAGGQAMNLSSSLGGTGLTGIRFMADNGANLYRAAAGQMATDGDFKLNAVGKGLYVKEGTNATMGVATLVAGTVTVPTTKVTANSRIFLSVESPGGTLGIVAVSARTPGTSFVITSSNALDTSNVAWLIMEPG